MAINKAVGAPFSCKDEQGKDSPLEVAIGIDYGRLLVVPGRDCFGDPVNIAYKLGEDVARAGEILITDTARARLPATEKQGDQPFTYGLESLELSVSGVEFPAFKVVFQTARDPL